MFPAIRDKKEWWAVALTLAICSFHLFDKWDALLAGENYAPAALLIAVPALTVFLLINISALRENAVEPRSEGTKS